MAGPSRRRSPRNAANAENAPAPSPVADTPSKTTTRADGGAVPEKENPAHEATPSSVRRDFARRAEGASSRVRRRRRRRRRLPRDDAPPRASPTRYRARPRRSPRRRATRRPSPRRLRRRARPSRPSVPPAAHAFHRFDPLPPSPSERIKSNLTPRPPPPPPFLLAAPHPPDPQTPPPQHPERRLQGHGRGRGRERVPERARGVKEAPPILGEPTRLVRRRHRVGIRPRVCERRGRRGLRAGRRRVPGPGDSDGGELERETGRDARVVPPLRRRSSSRPSPAPAPTPTPTPTPRAARPRPTATDPFLAFGVSPAASGGSKSHATPSEDGTIAFSHGVMSTPGSNLNLTGNLAGGGGGRPSDATSQRHRHRGRVRSLGTRRTSRTLRRCPRTAAAAARRRRTAGRGLWTLETCFRKTCRAGSRWTRRSTATR